MNKNINEFINILSKKYDLSVLEDMGKPVDIIYMVISHMLNMPVLDIKLNKNNMFLSDDDYILVEKYIGQMVKDSVPLQYITGKVKLYNEEYIVNSSVLIPRSDTEILIETAIKIIEENSFKKMLDLCTGSGCVGISISKNSSIETADLIDISKEAIDVANQNILLNKIEKKCKTYISDLFSDLPFDNLIKYDIIVGNPPYLETETIDTLSSYVKNEPKLALDGGVSGLDIYIRIFNEVSKYLKDGSFIILEIGSKQGNSIKKIISNYLEYELLEIVKDINSKDRVIVCRFHQK